jgi:hypothetical protein
MDFDRNMDLEKEIYKDNFEKGYKEGCLKAKLLIQENSLGEGIEVKNKMK